VSRGLLREPERGRGLRRLHHSRLRLPRGHVREERRVRAAGRVLHVRRRRSNVQGTPASDIQNIFLILKT